MAVKELSTEEKNAQIVDQASREIAFAKSLIDELPGIADKDKEEPKKEETVEDGEETTQEDTGTEEVGDGAGEEADPESTEDESGSEPEPKGVQKRIEKLLRDKRELEARLSKLEAQSEKSSDPDKEKLQSMNSDELREVKRKVRLAQIQNAADESKVAELMELEDKIDATIQSLPGRFNERQVARFNEAVASTDIDNLDSVKGKIFEQAKLIYGMMPEIHSSEHGQARAWQLAVEHFKSLSRLSKGKTQVTELERKVNNLKKKVSLDSTVQKGNSKMNDDARAYKKALSGSEDDKLNFLRKKVDTDQFLPDHLKGK